VSGYIARVTETMPEAVSRQERFASIGHRGATVWLTGLPAAGKTTLSIAIERELLSRGHHAYKLDGDEIRRELCRDLGFDRAARAENVRRVAHIARMLADAGVITVVALISPYAEDRQRAREMHDEVGIPFIEVFIDTPLEVCETRDPKGLYARARRGEVSGLTGVGGAYERPEQPDVRLMPGSIQLSVQRVLRVMGTAGIISPSAS
jgi:bifunctional enzyme CysN/CysC